MDIPYSHFKTSGRDLELTLDGAPIEYPALVKEAFLNNWHASAHRTEVTSNCASLNERHCWVLSRNQMFIWERAKKAPLMVRARLIDAAVFREGLMLLIGITHEESKTVHLFVAWMGPDWQTEQPTNLIWSAKIPMTEHRALFSKADESIYSNLTLCIPQNTAESKTADRTDGIIILNPFFDKFNTSHETVIDRSIREPTADQMLDDLLNKGFGCMKIGEKDQNGGIVSFLDQSLKLDTSESAQKVVNVINTTSSMKTLELRGNTMGIEAGNVISKALENHSELERCLWSDLFTGRLKNEIPPILESLVAEMDRALELVQMPEAHYTIKAATKIGGFTFGVISATDFSVSIANSIYSYAYFNDLPRPLLVTDDYAQLRYSREIANKQFGKASLTLMSLEESESKSFSKFAEFLTRAYYCACSSTDGTDVTEVLDFYNRRYPEMKHRKRIPLEILKTGYGSDLDVMMSVEEMLEWNMANQPNDEATVDGFARAFHLLADLLAVHPDSMELKEKIEKTWKALVDYDEWNRVKSKEDVEKKTVFRKFCDYLVGSYPTDKRDSFPCWMPLSRLIILPTDMDAILDESIKNTTGNLTSWIKGHIKWVGDQLVKLANLPKTAFFRPDMKEVGSITQSALEGFGPIFERREERFIEQLNQDTMMDQT